MLRVSARIPIPATTQTAHVVSPYTKASGKCVATEQHARSTFRAHPFRRLLLMDCDDEDGEGDRGVIS